MRSRITYYATHIKTHADTLIGLLLFATGLTTYTTTLAPTVLEGDAALFQYTPYALGVTYPTGYPLYILLGKLWVTLLPFGEIAWRMNLLSALMSSLALPLIYGAARRLFAPPQSPPAGGKLTPPPGRGRPGGDRIAAIAAVLLFATLPTFWRWSTEAKIYALNILLFSGVLYTLARALDLHQMKGREKENRGDTPQPPRPAALFSHYLGRQGKKKNRDDGPPAPRWPLALPVLLFGLQIAVHSTTVLLLPGLLLLVWLNLRPYLFTPRRFAAHTLLLMLPGLLYFYVPLRAEWLIAHLGRNEAIGMGLLADFYHSGLPGLVRYFTAADFTGGVVTNWGHVPQQFFSVYVPLLVDDFTPLGVALGIIGGLAYAFAAPRRFFPLLLLYAVPIPFVLTYGQGEQSAFLLPSFLVFALFGGYALAAAANGIAYVLRCTFAKNREKKRGDTPQAPRPTGLVSINQVAQENLVGGTPQAPRPTGLVSINQVAQENLVGNTPQAPRPTELVAKNEARKSEAMPNPQRVTHYALRFTFYVFSLLLLLLLTAFQLLPQTQRNTLWLSVKWNRDIYNEWADALNHPLDAGAGMLAHWGDLTSFWYMQHAEGRRPDLRGIYPPDEASVQRWFERGSDNLFIAGPLQGWAAGIQQRYQLLPWGRLVRIAPTERRPESLLPPLSQPVEAVFGDQLRLIATDFAPQAVAGQDFPVALTWQTLAEMGADATISLRLVRGDATLAQLDEPLRSGWFPRDTLPAGQYLLGYPLLRVPLGTLPGPAQLQLVSYADSRQPWPLPGGAVALALGQVEVIPPPPGTQPDSNEYKFPSQHDFNGEIRLAGFDYSVTRVGQGKGFALRLLWQALAVPADNYTLRVELLDAAGGVLRGWDVQPQAGLAPAAAWQPGQYIRDQLDLVVPASAPPGEDALPVRLSWLRPDGSRLNLRRWRIPLTDGLTLPPLHVTEKENRQFELPSLEQRLDANFEDKARLAGFNTRAPLACATVQAEACRVGIDFYWEGLAEMALPYQIFLHVVSPQGDIIAQSDHAPGARGKEPTTGWLPDEVILDPVDLPLPPGIAPGHYTLRLGLYLPPAGPRLQRLDSTGQPAADFVEVGIFEVR